MINKIVSAVWMVAGTAAFTCGLIYVLYWAGSWAFYALRQLP